MPLPKLELEPGVTDSWRSGRGFTDIRVLLRDLHEGVLELGVGKCEVLHHDVPREDKFGFDLCQDHRDHHRVWEFLIKLPDFRDTSKLLAPALCEEFKTGRARIARMLQAGMDTHAIEGRMQDPAVVYVRQKITKLKAEADKVQAEAQAEMKGDTPSPRRGPFGLGPQPATTHFLLQQRIAALADLAEDLDMGKHLP